MKYWSLAVGLCLLVSCEPKKSDKKEDTAFVTYKSANFTISKPKSWTVNFDKDLDGYARELGLLEPRDHTKNSTLILTNLPKKLSKVSDSVYALTLLDITKETYEKNPSFVFSSDKSLQVKKMGDKKVYEIDFKVSFDRIPFWGKTQVFTVGDLVFSSIYLMKADLVKENFPKMDSMIISIKTLK